MLKTLKKAVPSSWKVYIHYNLIWIKGKFDQGNKYECNICGKHANKFAMFNRRPNAMCPKCFSLERHRLLYDFLRKESDLFTKELSLLHFAAEKCLHKKLSANKNLRYETADLMNQFLATIEVKPKHRMSVTDIQFEDNSFDVLICNHVLEHVPEDIKAMQEIFRVLKSGGFAILQVPINLNSDDTLEDKKLSPDERRVEYGAADHLRFYGEKDYIARLEKVGFEVTASDHVKTLDADKHILDKNERIYCCKKP